MLTIFFVANFKFNLSPIKILTIFQHNSSHHTRPIVFLTSLCPLSNPVFDGCRNFVFFLNTLNVKGWNIRAVKIKKDPENTNIEEPLPFYKCLETRFLMLRFIVNDIDSSNLYGHFYSNVYYLSGCYWYIHGGRCNVMHFLRE